jgi:capsular exopolysaccharide synthesis family protein
MVTNLGLALAESQRRVLLIDADTRGPQLHSNLGLVREPGLSDLLLDQQAVTVELVTKAIQKTSTPGVHVLAAGTLSPAISSSFCSTRMKQILDVCRMSFDNVLIDSPPLMPFSDARALGRQSDSVVLVFRANRTSRQEAQTASQRLTEDGTRILGIILNDWTPHNAVYSRYYKSYSKTGATR